MDADLLWRETRRIDAAAMPFVRLVEAGDCPTELLGAYAMDLAALAAGFPQLLGGMLAACDRREARRIILANLLEEDGWTAGPHGLVSNGLDHAALARELATTFGVPTDRPLPVVRNRWIREQLQEGRWLGPLAFVTVGYEANVPAVFSRLVSALESRYGYSPAQLRYLRMHVAADAEHGADGVEVLASAADSPERAAEALDGARRGVTAWYHLHRQYAHRIRAAIPSPSAAGTQRSHL